MTTTAAGINLLEQLASAEDSAFRSLYRQYFNMVKYLVEQNNGDANDASDIFQETMIILFEKCRDGKLTLTAGIKTYIYSISRNLWLKKLRDRKRNVRLIDFEDYLEMEETSDEEIIAIADLKSIIENIGASCRQLLILFYYRKKSMQEICDSLGYANAETVKTQKYKCLQKIRKQVS